MRTRLAVLLTVLVMSAVAFSQTTLGNMFRLGNVTVSGLPASSSTITGSLIYVTDDGGLHVNNGSAWLPVSAGGSSGGGFWYDAGPGYIIAQEAISNPDAGAMRFVSRADNSSGAGIKEAITLQATGQYAAAEIAPSIGFRGNVGTLLGGVYASASNNSGMVPGLNLWGTSGVGIAHGSNPPGNTAGLIAYFTSGKILQLNQVSGSDAIQMQAGARVQWTGNARLYSLGSSNGLETDAFFRVGTFTTGGIPAASASNERGILYDSTLDVFKVSNGVAWLTLATDNFWHDGGAGYIYTDEIIKNPDAGATAFDSPTGNPAIKINTNGAQAIFGTGASAYLTGDGTGIETGNYFESLDYVQGATGFCSGTACAGTAFASFPAASSALYGRLRYDSTNAVWRSPAQTGETGNFSDQWKAIARGETFGGFLPSGVATAAAVLVATWRANEPGRVKGINLVSMAVGTGAGNYTVNVQNTTQAVRQCSLIGLGCSYAGTTSQITFDCMRDDAGVPDVAKGDILELQVDTSGCTTSPAINVNTEITGG